MALQGTLSYLDIAHLLQVVGTSKKSGVLEISWEDQRSRLYFHSGRLILAESNQRRQSIGTLLVEKGILSAEARDRALETQRAEGGGRRLGTILCEDFGVDQDDIERVLQRQYEQVVFDVFSWPGGRFEFQFVNPEEVLDRFHLNPMEFILRVGIQAGLLADEGVERVQDDPRRPPIVILEDRPEILDICSDHWRRRGHQVTACEEPGEVLVCLSGREKGANAPVVVVDLDPVVVDGARRRVELLDRVRRQEPQARLIALESGNGSPWVREAWARGVHSAVTKPGVEDLGGPHGEAHREVFLLHLDKAVELGAAGTSGTGGEASA